MKRILLVVLGIAAVFAVVGYSASPRSSEAGNIATWDDLAPGCFDVTGDGYVDLSNDILGVIMHYNAQVGNTDPSLPEYSLLYDVSGGGIIDLSNDILGTVLAYNTYCSPSGTAADVTYSIDRQVILATAATQRYKDCDDAVADGYGGQNPTGVWVANMGIHLTKDANINLPFYDPNELGKPPEEQQHQLTQPFGIVCTEKQTGPANRPDQLIGIWYVIPTPATGFIYGFNGTPQSTEVFPVGFGTGNDDEDSMSQSGQPDLDCVGLCNSGWHLHWNLCVANGSLKELGENFDPSPFATVHDWCKNDGGFIVINPYGFMLHFYNFIPNPVANGGDRFFKWNLNPVICKYMDEYYNCVGN